MFRKFFSRKAVAAPLSGGPLQPREKVYSAQSGYVYHYSYCGFRAHEGLRAATEFVFRISADRKNWRETSVWQHYSGIAAWESANQRTLSAAERYAIAKLALFQAFDDRAAPDAVDSVLDVGLTEISAIVETLGL
ncbi:MAG: hypothetical protein ACLQVN_09490 [Bryobacteraceae bacterium]